MPPLPTPSIDAGSTLGVRNSHPALTINIPALAPFDINHCDLFTLTEWVQAIKLGLIAPDDGSGFWGTVKGESTVSCFEDKPAWASHVIWYAK